MGKSNMGFMCFSTYGMLCRRQLQFVTTILCFTRILYFVFAGSATMTKNHVVLQLIKLIQIEKIVI